MSFGGIAFGPDGLLYIAINTGSGNIGIQRYDIRTNAFLGTFVAAPFGGSTNIQDIAFGPNGNLFVLANGTAKVDEYAAGSGAFLGVLVPGQTGGGKQLAFTPDGNTLMLLPVGGQLQRYDAETGAVLPPLTISDAASTSTSNAAADFTFLPGLALQSPVSPLSSIGGNVTVVQTGGGTITQPNGQVNFYSVADLAGATLGAGLWTFTVTANPGSTLDPKLTVYDNTGQLLATSDDTAPGNLNATVTFYSTDATQRDYYFLAVTAADGSNTVGTYTITTTFVPSQGPSQFLRTRIRSRSPATSTGTATWTWR